MSFLKKRPETSTTIQKKIKDLTDLLLKYSISYYQNHVSLVSDETFDKLMKELEELEKEYPEYVLPYSPTQYVGSDKTYLFNPVEHLTPMQSLENTYSEPEITQFMTSLQKTLGNIEFVTEFKIDGLSIACVYQDGKLIQASTRGDGTTGDDVTRNVLYIPDIPQELPFAKVFGSVPHLFEIRGEVFMTYKDFEDANAIRVKKGLEPLANPRNAASGTLKSLDPSVFKERKLHALFYHVAMADELPNTQSDMFYAFDRLGIPHAPFYHCRNQSDVLQAIGKIAQLRQQLPYPTDGAVVKVNSFSLRPKLGSTSKYPRWAKAYKFTAEQARTTVKAITIQVGRTGVLTPVAELEPVQLDGSVVKRATLHNSDMIRKLDVRVGDTVLLEKAGEVIPHILCSIEHQSGSKPYYLFEQVHGKCPACGCRITRKDDEVAWKCTNIVCPARVEEQIVYGVSKPALDIKGLGRAIIKALIRSGKVKSLIDLFDLSKEDLVHLQLYDKSYVGINGEKIWNEIQKAKEKKLDRWIVAMGIPGVGPAIALTVAKHFETFDCFVESYRDWEWCPDPTFWTKMPTTPSISDKIVEYINQPDSIIHAMYEHHIEPEFRRKRGPLYEKSFAITGTLSRPRAVIENLIKRNGGTINDQVCKYTNFLVQGESKYPSSKTKTAKKHGVMIITEDQLNQMLK